MGKLNKNLPVGATQTIMVKGRRVTFKKVKKSGFGMWRIIKNK